MTADSGRIGAIVLAGGRSSRFGRDKLAEPVDGRPLLDHAIGAVLALAPDVDAIVMAVPGSAPTIPDRTRLAHDDEAFQGPLSGVSAGLRALGADVDLVAVVGGDMPALSSAVLRMLLDAIATNPDCDAAVLADGDGHRPLPSALRRGPAMLVAASLLAAGERRLRALVTELETVVIPESAWRALDPTGGSLLDIDTPGDLTPGG
jgi:molybdopterin-guanine dinucleotide biosynthesis protein A